MKCGISSREMPPIETRAIFAYDEHGREVHNELHEFFRAEGLSFAYPTQTAFTAAPDGRMIMPYHDPDAPD